MEAIISAQDCVRIDEVMKGIDPKEAAVFIVSTSGAARNIEDLGKLLPRFTLIIEVNLDASIKNASLIHAVEMPELKTLSAKILLENIKYQIQHVGHLNEAVHFFRAFLDNLRECKDKVVFIEGRNLIRK